MMGHGQTIVLLQLKAGKLRKVNAARHRVKRELLVFLNRLAIAKIAGIAKIDN
jgi:hypothetical protein